MFPQPATAPIVPISFATKLFEQIFVERCICSHCLPFHSCLFPSSLPQPGFQLCHSTEAYLVEINKGLYLTKFKSHFLVLISFDLSAAFSTVHQSLSLDMISSLGHHTLRVFFSVTEKSIQRTYKGGN